MAPTDKDGNIEVFDVRSDNILYIGGKAYYDCATGEYFPELLKDETKKDDDDSPQSSVGRITAIDSIGTVGPGTTVTIF